MEGATNILGRRKATRGSGAFIKSKEYVRIVRQEVKWLFHVKVGLHQGV